MNETSKKIRIKFAKTGLMIFLGHLDLMRCFQKIIRRAGIPVAYSKGYSPHQIMSFAQPLGVGCESEGEYMDLEMEELLDLEIIQNKMQRECPAGLEIKEIALLSVPLANAMAEVERASYILDIPALTKEEKLRGIRNFELSDSYPVTKKTKKGTREMDLKKYVFELRLEQEGPIFTVLKSGSTDNIKPELLLQSIFKETFEAAGDVGFLCGVDYLVKRLDLFGSDGKALI